MLVHGLLRLLSKAFRQHSWARQSLIDCVAVFTSDDAQPLGEQPFRQPEDGCLGTEQGTSFRQHLGDLEKSFRHFGREDGQRILSVEAHALLPSLLHSRATMSLMDGLLAICRPLRWLHRLRSANWRPQTNRSRWTYCYRPASNVIRHKFACEDASTALSGSFGDGKVVRTSVVVMLGCRL